MMSKALFLVGCLIAIGVLVGDYQMDKNQEIARQAQREQQWQAAVESRDAIIQWWENQPPKTETITKTEVQIQEVEIMTEVIRYRPLQNFKSVEVLKDFLLEDDTNKLHIVKIRADGSVNYTGVCEEFAFTLRDNAQAAGYQLDTQILSAMDAIKWAHYIGGNPFEMGLNDGHYINKTVIGNEVWFIEPQNDNIWLAYHLE